MINKKFFLFPIVTLIFIYANHTGLQMLSYLCRSLMIATLAIFFYLSVKGKFNSFSVYVLLALSTSAISDGLIIRAQGDVLSSYFMWGLTCFFFSHIFYTIAFVLAPSKRRKGYLLKKTAWIIPFVLLQIAVLAFLWPDIPGNLRIPITIYSQGMFFMALATLNLKNQIPIKAFPTIALGAVLLIFSDIIISLIRFKVDQIYVPQPRLAIILSYLAGHYFLMTGSLKLMNSNLKDN